VQPASDTRVELLLVECTAVLGEPVAVAAENREKDFRTVPVVDADTDC